MNRGNQFSLIRQIQCWDLWLCCLWNLLEPWVNFLIFAAMSHNPRTPCGASWGLSPASSRSKWNQSSNSLKPNDTLIPKLLLFFLFRQGTRAWCRGWTFYADGHKRAPSSPAGSSDKVHSVASSPSHVLNMGAGSMVVLAWYDPLTHQEWEVLTPAFATVVYSI